MAKVCATYAENVPPMADANDWEIVNPGFKLEPPNFRRPCGRPPKLSIEGSHEKGSRLGSRKNKGKEKVVIEEVEDVQQIPEQKETQLYDVVLHEVQEYVVMPEVQLDVELQEVQPIHDEQEV